MKKSKRILALILTLVFLFCSGCAKAPEQDYDVSGYIDQTLYDSYIDGIYDNPETDTTAYNAAVRIVDKYGMNPSDEQILAMTSAVRVALLNSVFTVNDKVETDDGFEVVVSYDVQVTFEEIEDQINAIVDASIEDETYYDVGASYIDDVIALCASTAESPVYGDTEEMTFQVLLDESTLELSINLTDFDKLDVYILPV